MRSWQIVDGFGLDHLKMNEMPQEKLGSQDVRIKVRACSLNYRDLMVVKGWYNPQQPLPLTPVSDGAGEVMEVGTDVKDFKVGDKVCGTFSQKWDAGRVCDLAQKYTLGGPINGMLSESIVLNQQGLIKFPSFLTFAEAATLPCAAVTAFNALTQESSFMPGDTVLIEGTGGVSLFALQFAQVLNLKTIVISSSNDKLGFSKKLGATHTINYAQCPEWHEQVLTLTDGQGVDGVVEVGGAKTINKAIASVKRGGVITVIGILSGTTEAFDLVPILMRQIRIHGVFVGPKTLFAAMNRVIEHSQIHPVIDRCFEFKDAPQAFDYLESGAHFGKVVINVS